MRSRARVGPMRAMASSRRMSGRSLDRWPAAYERGRPGRPGEGIDLAVLLPTASSLTSMQAPASSPACWSEHCARLCREPPEAVSAGAYNTGPGSQCARGTEGEDLPADPDASSQRRCALLRPFIGSSHDQASWYRSQLVTPGPPGRVVLMWKMSRSVRLRGTRRSRIRAVSATQPLAPALHCPSPCDPLDLGKRSSYAFLQDGTVHVYAARRFLIMDNSHVHRARSCRLMPTRQRMPCLFFLPPYSHDLNRIVDLAKREARHLAELP